MKNLYLIFASVLFFCILLVLGEFFCRVFLDINYVGISKNLLISNAFGTSRGNAKNVEASAFGVKVFTDHNGFRIDPENKDKENYDYAVALIGDSVSFGVGVEENKTVVGLLRREYSNIKIYNTSVSGYRVNDYKNIVTEFILKKKGIKKVILLFCLNDVSYTPVLAHDEVQVDDARLKGTSSFFSFLAKINSYLKINTHLRQRSHLYHVLKKVLADPSMSYFLYDLQYYSKDNPYIEDDMKLMSEINDLLKNKNIELQVLILPYKVQLGSTTDSHMLPQQILSDYFNKFDINYIDALGEFQKRCRKPSDCFLFGDPLHLSAKGHQVVFDMLYKSI